MSADLHIHVIPNEPVNAYVYDYSKPKNQRVYDVTRVIDEDVLKIFFRNTFGSKWFCLSDYNDPSLSRDEAYGLISATPNVWVGEVSWLKASLLNDERKYIPGVVMQIAELIGEDLPVVDDDLIAKVSEILVRGDNETEYSVENADKIVAFLENHKGLRCFTVSW